VWWTVGFNIFGWLNWAAGLISMVRGK
jgi:hypothetical protein